MNLKPMSEISMLTILLRASAIVKNRIGDTSLHGYVETQEMESPKLEDNPSMEADFALLDSLSDILVQDNQVLAASYNDATSFTLVMPSSNSESDLHSHPNSFEMDFPPHESVGSATTLKSLNATIVPNTINHGVDHQSRQPLSQPLGEIHEIEGGKSLWIADDCFNPLQDDVLWSLR